MALKLTLTRLHQTPDHTFGLLRVGDKVFTTLEDAFHEPKIPKKTRIPAGTYQLDLRKSSPMASRYRERFGEKHIGMLWLQHVPQFEYVYLHTGNDEDDTDGCILVGNTADPEGGFVGQSTTAYKALYPVVMESIEGDSAHITIVERFV